MRRELGTSRYVGWLVLATVLVAGCGSPGGETPPPDDPVQPVEPLPELTAEERATLRTLFPEQLPPIPPDVTNPWAGDPRAQLFGQRLFFEPRFSGPLLDPNNSLLAGTLGKQGETGKVACTGCHLPQYGFVDIRSLEQKISFASGWTRRKTPSVLDIAYVPLLMWDGRFDAFFNQVFGPIENHLEMNSSRLYMAKQAWRFHRAEYEALFGPMPPLDDTRRFPDLPPEKAGCVGPKAEPPLVCHGRPGDGAEFDSMAPEDQAAVTRVVVNLGQALGAYQRLLTCGPSRFDAWMNGKPDAQVTASEVRGAQLFVGKAKCATCHSGPFLSDQKFHNVGLRPVPVTVGIFDEGDRGAADGLAKAIADPLNSRSVYSGGDDGRLPTALPEGAEGAFRTPMLRCVSQRPSFMHTGQLPSLTSVVHFFNVGGDAIGYPGRSVIQPLGLTDPEQKDLVAFMRALDGPGPDAPLRVRPQ